MKLSDLLRFDDIVIQCHNDPDADALASGYGVLLYLQSRGKAARLIYGGKCPIQKGNLVLMKRLLCIPAEYVPELEHEPQLLLTVDCKYGEGNVQKFPCRQAAVIDHHQTDPDDLPALHEIRDTYGACATIIWDMLSEEGFDVESNENLTTALYYGLFMDTNKLQELFHPKDRDLRDHLEFLCNRSSLLQFQNSNLSLEELKIAGDAMAECSYHAENRYAIAEVQPCDPNILGVISDMMMEVDSIDTVVAYCKRPEGVKYSVRCCSWETQAHQLSAYLAEGVGSGGGHMRKAGGFLKARLLQPVLEEGDVRQFFTKRLESYFHDQDVIQVENGLTENIPNLSNLPLYEKKRLPIGYVYAKDLGYAPGTVLRIRMLEGDSQVPIQHDTVLIIGAESEVYTNDEAYFLDHNLLTDTPYLFSGEYAPTVCQSVQAETPDRKQRRSLKTLAKTCFPKAGSLIHARQLDRCTKVLRPEKKECLQGMPGDWLAARSENLSDIYVIKKDIFEKTYAQRILP